MKVTMATKSLRRQAGLTLVELMVALLLSLILLYGVVTVFTANKETFRVQEGLSRVQETGRYAIQAIGRDLRRAGYGGCDTRSGFVRNTLGNTNWQTMLGNPVRGFNSAGGAWAPVWDAANPPTDALPASPPMAAASDLLVVNYVEPQGIRVNSHPTPTSNLSVSSVGDFAAGDLGMVADCRDAAIFQVTGIAAGVVQTGGANLGKKFTGAEALKLTDRIYYVATGAGGEPSLWRADNGGAPQELAEGVEALQVLYGEDTNSDGIADAYRTANAVTDWTAVTVVRVALVVRSANNVQRTAAAPAFFPFNENQLNVTDRRLRKRFTATVVLRSPMP